MRISFLAVCSVVRETLAEFVGPLQVVLCSPRIPPATEFTARHRPSRATDEHEYKKEQLSGTTRHHHRWHRHESCDIAKMTARCADKSKQTATPPPKITWLSVDSIQPDVVDHDHIGWKSWKLIVPTISQTSLLFVAQRSSTYSQGNKEKFWGENVRSTPTSVMDVMSSWTESTESHVILGGCMAVYFLRHIARSSLQ